MGETQPVRAPGGREIQEQTPKKAVLTCCIFITSVPLFLIFQEEEVLRVFPGMNAELRQSP